MVVKRRDALAWEEAKKRCQLNEVDIQMAKKLGMTPNSLIKNIPAPDQQGKAPVKEWVRDIYEEKFGRVLTVESDHSKATIRKLKKKGKPLSYEFWDDGDCPFDRYRTK